MQRASMQIKPLAPPLAAPAPASRPDAASTSDASFARQLQSRRSEAAAPAPQPAAHARRDEAARRGEAEPGSNEAQRGDTRPTATERSGRHAASDDAGHATAKTLAAEAEDAESRVDVRTRKAAGTGKGAPSPRVAGASIACEAETETDATAAAPGDTAVAVEPAVLAEWLARLAPPEAPGGAAPGAAAALPGLARAATAGDERSTAPGSPLEALARRADADRTAAAAADPAAQRIGTEPNDSRADPATAPSPTVLAADLHAEASAANGIAMRALHADVPKAGEAAPGNALATLGALGALGAAPHAASPTGAATPAQVSIAAHFGTPAFAPALAASVSLLARDGVQEARLQLHPAELGPIAVQIALDGAQARVDFTAEVAATRHAIEAGLPELASALREAGLTLAGGGVFQQPREARHGAPQDGTHDTRGSGGNTHQAQDDNLPLRGVAQRRVAVGGVDEYA